MSYTWDFKEISGEEKKKNKAKLLNKIISLGEKGVSVSDISKITNITIGHIYKVIKNKQFNKRRVRKKGITPIVVKEIVDRVLKVGSVRRALTELREANFLNSTISDITYRRYVNESDVYITWKSNLCIKEAKETVKNCIKEAKETVKHWNRYSLESSVLTQQTIQAFKLLGLEVPTQNK